MAGYGGPFGLRRVVLTDDAGGTAGGAATVADAACDAARGGRRFEVEGCWWASAVVEVSADWGWKRAASAWKAWAKLTGLTVACRPGRREPDLVDGGARWGRRSHYVRVYGRAVGDNGSDDVYRLYRCKAGEY